MVHSCFYVFRDSNVFLKDRVEKKIKTKWNIKPVPTIATQANQKYKVYFTEKNQIRPLK